MIVLVLMFAFNSQACDLHTRQHPDKPPYAQTISRLYVSVLGSIDQVLIVMIQFDQVTILHRPFPSGVDSGVTVWSGHNIAQTISQWCICSHIHWSNTGVFTVLSDHCSVRTHYFLPVQLSCQIPWSNTGVFTVLSYRCTVRTHYLLPVISVLRSID